MPPFRVKSDAFIGVRGVIALNIVLGHALTNFAPVEASRWPLFPLEYFQAVSLFFLLSGTALVHGYKPSSVDSKSKRINFWFALFFKIQPHVRRRRKRFARIAPMYYTSLVVALAPFLHYTRDLTDRLLNFFFAPLFLQSLTLVGNDWSGILWQISSFMMCYFLFPWISPRLTRWSAKMAIVLLVLYTMPLLVMVLALVLEWPAGIVHTWAPVRIPQFVIGCWLGLCMLPPSGAARADERKELVPTARRSLLPSLLADVASLVMLSTYVVCALLGHYVSVGAWWRFMLVGEFALIPLHCLWLFALIRAENQPVQIAGNWYTRGGGVAVRLFSCKLLQDLGEISYSLYVLHYPVFQLFSWLLAGTTDVPLQLRDRQVMMGLDNTVDGLYLFSAPVMLAAVSLVLVLAILFNRVVEAPMRQRLSPARETTTPVATTKAPPPVATGHAPINSRNSGEFDSLMSEDGEP